MKLAPLLPLLLVACGPSVTATDPSGSDSDVVDDSDDITRTFDEAGVCVAGEPSPRPSGPFTAARDASPYGTGDVQTALGALEGELPNLANPRAVDTSLDLASWPFDVYVPPAYDGSEPYGLVAFVNSGNGGAPRGGLEGGPGRPQAHLDWAEERRE